jgi:CBS domain-containing protein
MRADEFLNLYKRLEELLTARYASRKKRYSSPIVEFASDVDGKRWREELNLCRDIRNLLSHHSELDGGAVIEPSEAVIKTLKTIVNYVEHPVVAADIYIPLSQLFVTRPDASVRDVIVTMDEKGYSHVPIVEGRCLIGVFSASTVFSYIRGDNGNVRRPDVMRISDFAAYTPPDKHSTECFRFMRPSENCRTISEAFSIRPPKSKRLAAIFITDNGRSDGSLMGMITPWDALRAVNKEMIESE